MRMILVRALAVALLGSLVSACTTYPPSNFPAECSIPPPATQLMPGDEIEVAFLGAADLSSTQVIPLETSQSQVSVPSRSIARTLYPPPGNTTTAAPVLPAAGE